MHHPQNFPDPYGKSPILTKVILKTALVEVDRGGEVFGTVAEHCVLEEHNSKL